MIVQGIMKTLFNGERAVRDLVYLRPRTDQEVGREIQEARF